MAFVQGFITATGTKQATDNRKAQTWASVQGITGNVNDGVMVPSERGKEIRAHFTTSFKKYTNEKTGEVTNRTFINFIGFTPAE